MSRPEPKTERLKPAVPRGVARALAGLLWLGAGALLAGRGLAWALVQPWGLALAGLGILAAAAFWRFVFARLVGRSLERLAGMPERMCVFALQSWKGWAMVGVMVPAGILMRHSPLARAWLVPPYLAMGGVLAWGGVQILRGLLPRHRQDAPSSVLRPPDSPEKAAKQPGCSPAARRRARMS